jgi:hypothetical protein
VWGYHPRLWGSGGGKWGAGNPAPGNAVIAIPVP